MFENQPSQPTIISGKSRLLILPAKFNLGDRVYWFRVPSQDFGTVLDCFYGAEGSVQALGWHYTIQLDPDSPSFDHCKFDYGFEDDLALMEPGEADAVE